MCKNFDGKDCLMMRRICIFADLFITNSFTYGIYARILFVFQVFPFFTSLNMKRMLLVFLLLAVSLAVFAQGAAVRSKLSATTRMLLCELEEESAADELEEGVGGRRLKGVGLRTDGDGAAKVRRSYAAPVTMDGRRFVSSFVRLREDGDLSALEALGVRVQSRFENGLLTAWVPVDGIEALAALEEVVRINVSPVAQVHSDAARRDTHVDAVLSRTEEALNAGVTGRYDGSGVLLAIIDIGIDFQHIAFRNSAGGYRMKGAFLYDGRNDYVYDSFEGLTTDNSVYDHGTHVASLAGGSSVVAEGSGMRVTNDHGSATYGGMAPGADLYLCGFYELEYTHIANAIKEVCDYADAHGQPVVVCNSWGSQDGPHDGTGEISEVIDQYFGEDHPNHICLFASGNYAGYSQKGAGGGFYVWGEGSVSHPLRTIVNHNNAVTQSDGYTYSKTIASAWTRSHGAGDLACRVYVLDAATGEVLDSATVTRADANRTDSRGLYAKVPFSSYYSGYLQVYFDESGRGAKNVKVYALSMTTKKKHRETVEGSTVTVSDYTLAVGFFPVEGTEVIDVWAGSHCYFSNHLRTEGCEWTAGTDDFSVTDEATFANSISVGAYVSKNVLTDHAGVVHDASNDATLGMYKMGDIAYFSSYAMAGVGAAVVSQPAISAPGAVLVGAVNHYNKSSSTSYLADVLSGSGKYRMNDDTLNPYGSMSGTSMSAPVAAGVVALWLQAAQEVGKSLTVGDVKRIMERTAVRDAFTNGENGSHFGVGKLDALAGLRYILGVEPQAAPVVSASADTLVFSAVVGDSVVQKLVVSGEHLTDSVKVELIDSLGVFVLDSVYTKIEGKADGDTIVVAFKAKEEGEYAGQLVLSSNGADSVLVVLKGIAEPVDTIPEPVPTIIASADTLAFRMVVGDSVVQKLVVLGEHLTDSVKVELMDSLGMFVLDSVYTKIEGKADGDTIVVAFKAKEEGEYAGQLVLSSAGADSVLVALKGIAEPVDTIPEPVPSIIASADTLAFSAVVGDSVVQKLVVSGEHLADSVKVELIDSLGVFVLDSVYTKIEGSADGDTIVVAFTAKEAGEYAGQLVLSSNGADSVLVALKGIAEADTIPEPVPTIIASADTLAFSAVVGDSVVQKLVVSGVHLTDSVKVELMDSLGVFVLDSVYTKIEGSADGDTIVVAFKAKEAGEYAGQLVLSSVAADSVLVALKGIAEPVDTIPEPVPTIIASADTLSFGMVVGDSVVQKLVVSGEHLTDSVTVELIDSLGVFVLDSVYTKIEGKADGDTIVVAFTAKEAGEYAGQLVLSCAGADSVLVALKGIAEADTIPEPVPIIIASADTLVFSAVVEDSVVQKLVVSGEHLTDSVKVELMDSLGVFVLDSVYTKIEGSADGDTIVVAFKAKEEGKYAGQLVLSSNGADSVLVALKGIAEVDTIPEPVPTIIASADTLAFSAVVGDSVVQKLVVSGEHLTDSVKVELMDSLGVFVLDSVYTKIEGSADGDTIVVAFTAKEAGEYAGQLVLSSNGADSVLVALKGIAEADTIPEPVPTIIASADTLSFSAVVGDSVVQKLLVSGEHLTDSVKVELMDSLGVFVLDSVYTKIEGSADGDTIVVAFTAKEAGEYAGQLVLSSNGADSVLVALKGIAEADTIPEPVPSIIASADTLAFSAVVGDNVVQKLVVSGEHLTDSVKVELIDSLGVYVLDSVYTKIEGKAEGDTIVVAFMAKEEGEYAGQLVLSSNGADSVLVALKGIAEADTIPEPVPSIIASADTLAFSAVVGDSVVQKLVVSGEHLSDSVKVELMDSLGVFVLDSIYTKIEGSANGDTIVVTFTAKEEGEYAGQLVLSCNGADSVLVALKGIAEADTIPEPVPSIIASADTLAFSAVVGDSVVQKLVVSGEHLTDSVKVELIDSLGVFVLDSIYTKIEGKADGDTIVVAFKAKEAGEYAGQLVLSSNGADSVLVALKGIAEADTIPEPVPTIIASADTLTFETPIGVQMVQRVMVQGFDLSDSIHLSVEDSLGVFSLDSAYISLEKAMAGDVVSVRFAPIGKTSEIGSLTLSSKNAQPVLITLICESDYELGDVNKDGAVDISDVVMTVNYVLGSETEKSVWVYGDMDGNGMIDITDVVAIVNKILGTLRSE